MFQLFIAHNLTFRVILWQWMYFIKGADPTTGIDKKNSYFSHAVKLHCFMRVKLKPKNSLWETSSQIYIYIYIYIYIRVCFSSFILILIILFTSLYFSCI